MDLPLPFWPTIATRLAGAGSRGRRRRAPASRPGRRSRRRRARSSSCRHSVAGSRPPRARSPARAGRSSGGSTPIASSRSVGEDVCGGSVEHDPSAVDDDDPVAQPVEQVGLVLGDQQRRPGRRPAPGAPRRRGACRPGRAGPSARRGPGGRGRIASSEAIADELGLAAGESSRLALDEVLDAERATALAWSARRSRATGRPRFIGPRATSSKTEPVTPDSCVVGFWKPIATRVANS